MLIRKLVKSAGRNTRLQFFGAAAVRWRHPQERRQGAPIPAPDQSIIQATDLAVTFTNLKALCGAVVPKVLEDGICQIDNVLDPEIVAGLRQAVSERRHDAYSELLAARQPGDPAESEFFSACVRDGARLDVVGLESTASAHAVEAASSILQPLCRVLLERDVRRVWAGAFIALPSATSDAQQWHADTPHLFRCHLPPHVLSVLIPLTDLTFDNGPTEFRRRSHIYGNLSGQTGGRGVVLCAPVGSVVVYDFRIEHRGLANITDSSREVAYLTFAKNWWRDIHNKRASHST